MSIHTFAYIILSALALMSAFTMAVSTVEPPLEDYEPAEESLEPGDPAGEH
jgi:hypothetical protein